MTDTTAQTLTTPLRDLLAEHFGTDPLGLPVVAELFETWDHVNLQAGLDAYLAQDGIGCQTHGVTVPPPAGGSYFPPEPPSLENLLTLTGARLGSLDVVELPSGPDSVASCIRTGLVLLTGPRGPLAVWVRPDSLMFGRKVGVDVQAVTTDAAQEFLDALKSLAKEHSVFRGRVVRFTADVHGNIDCAFDPRPALERDELILPPSTIEGIEAHAIGIAETADRLRSFDRHLKRGLLLYGPPGTGKTLTIRYLVSRLETATVFVLTGTAMAWLRFVTKLATELTPAVIVLDDVDLIAEDRNLGGMSPRRHLFDLLDAMDGLHEDSDVLFVCTTNRPETLEKAISARPGRIDQAVAVELPDADCRRRLIGLYGRGLDLSLSDVDTIVARTEGVTASFVKELLRKASVIAVLETPGAAGLTVTDAHVHAAIDTLLDPLNPLTATLLGGAPRPTGGSA